MPISKKIHRDKFNESQSMFLPLVCPLCPLCPEDNDNRGNHKDHDDHGDHDNHGEHDDHGDHDCILYIFRIKHEYFFTSKTIRFKEDEAFINSS